MSDFDTKTIISDEVLVKNIDLIKNGDLEDKKCVECDLSSILHPYPKKHHCDIVNHKTKLKDNWVNAKLELVDRMNHALLKSAADERKLKETNVNEMLVSSLTLLADKIEKIAVPNTPTSEVSTVKTQMVARRNCPSWTAGISIDVYSRWVKDWNQNDNSDQLIKYMDITRNLSENKVIFGLKEYMKKIVMPSLSATSEETVEAVLEKLAEKYKKNAV